MEDPRHIYIYIYSRDSSVCLVYGTLKKKGPEGIKIRQLQGRNKLRQIILFLPSRPPRAHVSEHATTHNIRGLSIGETRAYRMARATLFLFLLFYPTMLYHLKNKRHIT